VPEPEPEPELGQAPSVVMEAKFTAIAACDARTARRYLSAHGGDLAAALNSFLNGGGAAAELEPEPELGIGLGPAEEPQPVVEMVPEVLPQSEHVVEDPPQPPQQQPAPLANGVAPQPLTNVTIREAVKAFCDEGGGRDKADFLHSPQAEAVYGAVGSWDVAAITDMSGLFKGCERFNQPLEAWSVDQVTDMSGMFEGAAAFNQPLEAWSVDQVTNVESMFCGARAFNQPLEAWRVEAQQEAASLALAQQLQMKQHEPTPEPAPARFEIPQKPDAPVDESGGMVGGANAHDTLLKVVMVGDSGVGKSSGRSPALVPRWVPDAESETCPGCAKGFGMFRWRHHCRRCGVLVCDGCSQDGWLEEWLDDRPPHAAQTARGCRDYHGNGGGRTLRVCAACRAQVLAPKTCLFCEEAMPADGKARKCACARACSSAPLPACLPSDRRRHRHELFAHTSAAHRRLNPGFDSRRR
jgi:hypothetical protein